MRVGIVYSINVAEAEVSQRSCSAVFDACQNVGYDVVKIPFTANFIEDILSNKVDIVFNAMHGKYGEDGYIQTILNAMKVPYTHSGFVASQIGMNKILTNVYANSVGIKTIKSVYVSKFDIIDGNYTIEKKSFIKPVNGGSSVATFLLNAGEKLTESQTFEVKAFADGDMFMIEEFFAGIETGIVIFNNKALGSFQVIPAEEFYSYNAKYKTNTTQYLVPANIDKKMEEMLFSCAEKLHKIIGADCISRVDFLVNANDYRLLEINTHPGFTNTSLVPKVAKYRGVSFAEIVQVLIDNAKFEKIDDANA